MIELLYTSLVLCIFFIPVFFVFPVFKQMKTFIIFFQLLISFILLSKNFYKKHSLYKDQKFEFIQSLDFCPINSLSFNSSTGEIQNDTMSDKNFSLIKKDKFSLQCLEHYFINKNELCPITDIKLGKGESNEYQNYFQMNDNEYIYYTRENKLGKLYKSFNYSDFKNNIENSSNIDNIVKKEFNKLSNPVIEFKNYIKFCDVVCLILLLISAWYSVFESLDDLRFGWFRITNILIQFTILVLNIIRYIKFIEVKQFLIENKEMYKEKKYFPSKVFNIDSFPLALSINIFIFNILYFVFPNKISFHKIDKNHFNLNKHFIVFCYLIPFPITLFIVGIFDFIND